MFSNYNKSGGSATGTTPTRRGILAICATHDRDLGGLIVPTFRGRAKVGIGIVITKAKPLMGHMTSRGSGPRNSVL